MSNSIPAAFGVNRYLWKKIEDMGILDKANYNGFVPVIPTQEEPTFLQAMEAQAGIGSFPYIVYAWNTNGYGTSYWESTDQIIYLIYSSDQTKLRELVLLIGGLFKRFDESADEINKYIQTATVTDPDTTVTSLAFSDAYRAYEYKFTSVQSISANMPKNDENQGYRAMITIAVNYTHIEDVEPIADLYQNG